MDKNPLNSDRTEADAYFASFIAEWDNIAEQINDGLHEGEEDEEVLAQDVRRALELIGVTLRSADGPELLGLFAHLNIDLQALLTDEGTSIQELFAHEHADMRVMTEPITDELPTWSVKCRKCGEGRRVVRT